MTEAEIKAMLEESNIPVFRGHAPIGESVPYMIYHVTYPENMGADNITYYKIPQVTVDLYQTAPSLELWESIENILTENELSWSSDEVDMEDEGLFIKYYYFGGLSNGRE